MFEANVAAAERLFTEGWSRGELGVLDEVCGEGYVGHDPLLGDSDLSTAKERIAMYREAYPDLKFEVEDIFEAGDKVVARWRATGTFENPLMGQEPTHEAGDPITGITIDRFEDGELVESWVEWNSLLLMQNMGVIPAGGVLAEH
jgi:predicted ester cyclase